MFLTALASARDEDELFWLGGGILTPVRHRPRVGNTTSSAKTRHRPKIAVSASRTTSRLVPLLVGEQVQRKTAGYAESDSDDAVSAIHRSVPTDGSIEEFDGQSQRPCRSAVPLGLDLGEDRQRDLRRSPAAEIEADGCVHAPDAILWHAFVAQHPLDEDR